MSYSALPTCAGCKVTIYGTPIPVQGEDHCSVECCWDAGQAAGYLNAAADAEDYPNLEDNLERAQRRVGELVTERDRLRAALAVTRAALEEIRAYEHFPYATIAISALKRAANVAPADDRAEPEEESDG
jgi:hypothetical protein